MQSKELMKKLADTYDTLVFVSMRNLSSISRLKNLLMSEGIPETSARRKIADLDTADGCLVSEKRGRLELNHELLQGMFLQLQKEFKISNYLEEKQNLKCIELEHTIGQLQKQMEELQASHEEEIEKYKNVISDMRKEAKRKEEEHERDIRWDRNAYLETYRELEAANGKITRMMKGYWSYHQVRREARREESPDTNLSIRAMIRRIIPFMRMSLRICVSRRMRFDIRLIRDWIQPEARP